MRERLHLDRRAHLLARVGEEGGSGDDLLNTTELAEWLTVSTQWVEIGRHKGYGPPYVKLAGKVRYRRSDVVAWLGERTHRRTSEYPDPGTASQPARTGSHGSGATGRAAPAPQAAEPGRGRRLAKKKRPVGYHLHWALNFVLNNGALREQYKRKHTALLLETQ